MITIDEIYATNLTLDDKAKDYAVSKLSKLEKYIPKASRKSASARVVFSLDQGSSKLPTCEVILNLPGKVITAKESTVNMFSSIDVVESKLQAQLTKYKHDHQDVKNRRSIRRLLGKTAR